MNDDVNLRFTPHRCPNCNGYGTVSYGKSSCKVCSGIGAVVVDQTTGLIVKTNDDEQQLPKAN